jgi:hypothetical protein
VKAINSKITTLPPTPQLEPPTFPPLLPPIPLFELPSTLSLPPPQSAILATPQLEHKTGVPKPDCYESLMLETKHDATFADHSVFTEALFSESCALEQAQSQRLNSVLQLEFVVKVKGSRKKAISTTLIDFISALADLAQQPRITGKTAGHIDTGKPSWETLNDIDLAFYPSKPIASLDELLLMLKAALQKKFPDLEKLSLIDCIHAAKEVTPGCYKIRFNGSRVDFMFKTQSNFASYDSLQSASSVMNFCTSPCMYYPVPRDALTLLNDASVLCMPPKIAGGLERLNIRRAKDPSLRLLQPRLLQEFLTDSKDPANRRAFFFSILWSKKRLKHGHVKSLLIECCRASSSLADVVAARVRVDSYKLSLKQSPELAAIWTPEFASDLIKQYFRNASDFSGIAQHYELSISLPYKKLAKALIIKYERRVTDALAEYLATDPQGAAAQKCLQKADIFVTKVSLLQLWMAAENSLHTSAKTATELLLVELSQHYGDNKSDDSVETELLRGLCADRSEAAAYFSRALEISPDNRFAKFFAARLPKPKIRQLKHQAPADKINALLIRLQQDPTDAKLEEICKKRNLLVKQHCVILLSLLQQLPASLLTPVNVQKLIKQVCAIVMLDSSLVEEARKLALQLIDPGLRDLLLNKWLLQYPNDIAYFSEHGWPLKMEPPADVKGPTPAIEPQLPVITPVVLSVPKKEPNMDAKSLSRTIATLANRLSQSGSIDDLANGIALLVKHTQSDAKLEREQYGSLLATLIESSLSTPLVAGKQPIAEALAKLTAIVDSPLERYVKFLLPLLESLTDLTLAHCLSPHGAKRSDSMPGVMHMRHLLLGLRENAAIAESPLGALADCDFVTDLEIMVRCNYLLAKLCFNKPSQKEQYLVEEVQALKRVSRVHMRRLLGKHGIEPLNQQPLAIFRFVRELITLLAREHAAHVERLALRQVDAAKILRDISNAQLILRCLLDSTFKISLSIGDEIATDHVQIRYLFRQALLPHGKYPITGEIEGMQSICAIITRADPLFAHDSTHRHAVIAMADYYQWLLRQHAKPLSAPLARLIAEEDKRLRHTQDKKDPNYARERLGERLVPIFEMLSAVSQCELPQALHHAVHLLRYAGEVASKAPPDARRNPDEELDLLDFIRQAEGKFSVEFFRRVTDKYASILGKDCLGYRTFMRAQQQKDESEATSIKKKKKKKKKSATESAVNRTASVSDRP